MYDLILKDFSGNSKPSTLVQSYARLREAERAARNIPQSRIYQAFQIHDENGNIVKDYSIVTDEIE